MFAYARTLVGNCAFTMTHGRLVRSELAVPVGYDPGTTHPLRPPACPAVCVSTSVCSLRLFIRPAIRLSVRLLGCPPAGLFTCMPGHRSVCTFGCPPVCPIACLHRLSVHMSVPLFVSPPTCLYSCLFAPCLFSRVSVHQPVHLYIQERERERTSTRDGRQRGERWEARRPAASGRAARWTDR